MKKYVAILLTVLLAVGMLCVGVSAEETTTTAATASQAQPVTLSVRLEMDVDDNGTVTVYAIDSEEMPVPAYQMSLSVNGMTYTDKTDANGKYVSPYTVDEGNSAKAVGLQTVAGFVTYLAATEVSVERAAATTTTVTTTTSSTETTASSDVQADASTTVSGDTTTTTEETTTTTTTTTTTAPTAETTATVRGAGTTAVEDGIVSMNASTDTALLEAFGLSRSEFGAVARLLLSEAHYEALVGRTTNVPMLSVRTTEAVSSALLQAAIANVSEFSAYAEDQRQAITFDLSLQMVSRNGKEVAVTVLPDDVLYTVQLPVPTPMKDCKTFAVTVMDGEALMAPQAVEVKDGMFELQLNSLEPYTLIAFSAGAGEQAGGISWRLVLLLVVGLLLIGGAAVLLYLFVFRKPEETEEEAVTVVTPEENDTDIFSGRTDMGEVWDPEDN